MTEVNTNSDIKITLTQKFETNTVLIFCAHSVPIQWFLILIKLSMYLVLIRKYSAYLSVVSYSQVPIKRVGPNKQVGWIF